MPDSTAELTQIGRERAIAKAKEQPGRPERGWAAGSPRIRSAHTALLRLKGHEGKLMPEMSFEEARDLVNSELKVGKKVTTLSELNFYWEGTPEFNAESGEAYRSGRGLEWVLKESDARAVALKDRVSTSYSRTAANYAALISREMAVGNNFNRIVAADPEKYKEAENTIERWLGTHQMVAESFIMKVLEKTQGRAAAERFIELFRDKDGKVNGVDFQEGIEVEIMNGPEGQRVILHPMRSLPDIELTEELLAEMMKDAEELDTEIDRAEAAEQELS